MAVKLNENEEVVKAIQEGLKKNGGYYANNRFYRSI